MSSVFDTDLGTILDHYADVIEGGNSWRGSGTAMKGIPGQYPSDKYLRDESDTPLTVVGSSVSTTTFDVASGSWPLERWVSDRIPPFFVTSPDDETRKITGWNSTTKVFTIAPAFSAAPSASDEMVVRQGFKRIGNQHDIDGDTGMPDGYDRFFHLTAKPGTELSWYGDGYKHFKTTLDIRLRIGKFGRIHDWAAAVFSNLAILRAVLVRQDLYPSTYVRALFSAEGQEAEIKTDDDKKIVAIDKYTLIYKVDGTYK